MSDGQEQTTSLLVARTGSGRVSVVRLDSKGLGIVRAADQPRSAVEIAERSGVDQSAVASMLGELADVGAVRFSIGS